MADLKTPETPPRLDEEGEGLTFEAVVKVLDVITAIFMFFMMLLVGNSLRQRK